MAFHPPFARLQDTEALIFVDGTRHYRRLLPDHSFPNDFGVDSITDRIVNEPAPREELCGHRPDVLDADKVREDVMTL